MVKTTNQLIYIARSSPPPFWILESAMPQVVSRVRLEHEGEIRGLKRSIFAAEKEAMLRSFDGHRRRPGILSSRGTHSSFCPAAEMRSHGERTCISICFGMYPASLLLSLDSYSISCCLLKVVTFNSYVSLPEGKWEDFPDNLSVDELSFSSVFFFKWP